jgi:hypothetical protein
MRLGLPYLHPLEDDHATTTVSGRQVLTSRVKFDGGDDVHLGYLLEMGLSEDLAELPVQFPPR